MGKDGDEKLMCTSEIFQSISAGDNHVIGMKGEQALCLDAQFMLGCPVIFNDYYYYYYYYHILRWPYHIMCSKAPYNRWTYKTAKT
jgi:hypothetical protein